MVRLAAWREGSGHRHKDNFLVFEFFGGVVFLWYAAGRWVGFSYWCPAGLVSFDVDLGARREAYSNFTPSGNLSPTVGAITLKEQLYGRY